MGKRKSKRNRYHYGEDEWYVKNQKHTPKKVKNKLNRQSVICQTDDVVLETLGGAYFCLGDSIHG